jgi:hypothetical protein
MKQGRCGPAGPQRKEVGRSQAGPIASPGAVLTIPDLQRGSHDPIELECDDIHGQIRKYCRNNLRAGCAREAGQFALTRLLTN